MSIKVKDFLSDISEKEYRKYKAASYSALSKLSNEDYSIFTESDDTFKRGLSLGSVVDSMIFDDKFDVYKEYNIVSSIPDFNSDNAINQLLSYIKDTDTSFVNKSLDELNELSKKIGLWGNIKKDDLRIVRIDTDSFHEGLKFLELESNGKPFLLTEDLALAMKMVEVLRTNKNTKSFFLDDNPNIETVFQGKILFEINGRPAKSMLDILIIDHENKIIYPVDLKTGAEKSFYANFNRYNYPLQAAFYTLAVKALIESTDDLREYKVAPFQFIYISRAMPNKPTVYDMHELYIELGINGWTSTMGVRYKGALELFRDYYWHLDNKVFDTSREEYRRGKRRISAPYDAMTVNEARELIRGWRTQAIEPPTQEEARPINVEVPFEEEEDERIEGLEF